MLFKRINPRKRKTPYRHERSRNMLFALSTGMCKPIIRFAELPFLECSLIEHYSTLNDNFKVTFTKFHRKIMGPNKAAQEPISKLYAPQENISGAKIVAV